MAFGLTLGTKCLDIDGECWVIRSLRLMGYMLDAWPFDFKMAVGPAREREDGYLRWNLLKVLSFLGWSGSVRSRGERRSSINRSYRNRIPACSYSSVSFGHLSQEKEMLTHGAKPAFFDGSWEVNILDYPLHVTAHGFMAYILIHFDSRIVWSLYFLALQLCEVSSCLQEAMDAASCHTTLDRTFMIIYHLSSFITISFVKDLRGCSCMEATLQNISRFGPFLST